MSQVFPGGPAHMAGINQGDCVCAVDGASTQELSILEVCERVKGHVGTRLTISLMRPEVLLRPEGLLRPDLSYQRGLLFERALLPEEEEEEDTVCHMRRRIHGHFFERTLLREELSRLKSDAHINKRRRSPPGTANTRERKVESSVFSFSESSVFSFSILCLV